MMGFLLRGFLPAFYNHIDIFGIQLTCPALPPQPLTGYERGAGAAEGIQHNILGLARILDGTFHQIDWLHGGVQIIDARLVHKPDIALIARTAPVPIIAFLPAVKDRLVLALIIRASQREGVFRPYNKSRPFAACGYKRFLQRMQLG